MFQLEKESLCLEEDNLSHNSKQEDLKVIFNIILAPGPGTYRLPSDFGHYDNIEVMRTSFSKGDFEKTGRTNSSSNDIRKQWLLNIYIFHDKII